MGSVRKDERDEYAIVFGRRLEDAFRAVGLSQAEAARRLEVPPSRVSEYVRGVILPPASTIDRLISVLDLDPRILFPEWIGRVRFTSHELPNDIGVPVGTAVPEK